ncbi:substrate-binding domain-containing protein [Neomegalonema sp.]|uniref:substrate-binding domain-containing protein n=1 Tax=Neomegalonema sp. TaxID=2039713 RepID=UPI00262A0B3C|nr:substrate-binding domain-containing protein [Neomegalonema sp.]MDD2867459.1 substrate-binding domain-containing protein [Neomegalonema sp.]
MRKTTMIALTCALLAPAAAAQPREAAQEETPRMLLRFAGSNAMGARLLPELGRAFLEASGYVEVLKRQGAAPEDLILSALSPEDEEVEIGISAHGSPFRALRAGTADLGMASRPVRSADQEAAGGSGLSAHVVALDAVTVVVHPDNPAKALSLAQLRDLFSGRTTDWSRIDPAFKGPVRLLVREADSGSADLFKSVVMEGRAFARSAESFASNADLAAAAAGDPLALGFLGGPPGAARPLALAQDCGLVSAPEPFALKTGEYPLARRLTLLRRSAGASQTAQDFVAFALSEAARPALAAAELTDLEVVASPRGYGDEAIRRSLLLADKEDVGLADMQDFARFAADPEARRLSVTFRFTFGGAELDENAARDVERLAAYWKALKQEQPRRRLAALGFTDSLGVHADNRWLARDRARAVAARLAAAGVKTDLVVGWGEIAPVACDWKAGRTGVDAAGQGRNRRVEIWIY